MVAFDTIDALASGDLTSIWLPARKSADALWPQLWFAFSRISRVARVLRPLQVSACGLLAFGMIWFLLRLRS